MNRAVQNSNQTAYHFKHYKNCRLLLLLPPCLRCYARSHPSPTTCLQPPARIRLLSAQLPTSRTEAPRFALPPHRAASTASYRADAIHWVLAFLHAAPMLPGNTGWVAP